jgi:hypothetical protein
VTSLIAASDSTSQCETRFTVCRIDADLLENPLCAYALTRRLHHGTEVAPDLKFICEVI